MALSEFPARGVSSRCASIGGSREKGPFVAIKYLFADESGDLQFLRNGKASRYFAVGTLCADEEQVWALRTRLMRLRDELAWKAQGLDSCFHASPDAQVVRDAVFDALVDLEFRFDITLLEKSKAQPSIRPTEPKFYQYAWFFHLSRAAPQLFHQGDSIQVVAAQMGTRKTRAAFRGAVDDVMAQCLPFRAKRVLAFWRDESDFGLQAADYCTWAVTRKWETGDDRAHRLIRSKIRIESDYFGYGTEHYY